MASIIIIQHNEYNLHRQIQPVTKTTRGSIQEVALHNLAPVLPELQAQFLSLKINKCEPAVQAADYR